MDYDKFKSNNSIFKNNRLYYEHDYKQKRVDAFLEKKYKYFCGVVNIIREHYNLDEETFYNSRKKKPSRARGLCFYFLYNSRIIFGIDYFFKYKEIGRHFNRKQHQTIIYATESISFQIAKYKDVAEKFDLLKKEIKKIVVI